VAAVPGLDKGHFRSLFPGLDAAEENTKCSQLLGDIILGLGAQIDPTIPSVLMSHYTVVGCQLENGEHIFTQSDVVLPKETIAASPFDLVSLGHIHRAQEVPNCGRPTFYSGPVNGITFNEEGQDKGFWLHEIGTIETDEYAEMPNYYESEFIKTPSREFLTLEAEDEIDWFIETGIDCWFRPDDEGCTYYPSPKDKIVRVHYTCSEETNKRLNRKSLEKALHDAGAFHVAEIKPVQVITALTKQELSENDGPLENLKAWSEREGIEEADALITIAKPPNRGMGFLCRSLPRIFGMSCHLWAIRTTKGITARLIKTVPINGQI
jgi:exonuclease SbcC